MRRCQEQPVVLDNRPAAKVAVVTGGAAGIGLAICRALVKSGMRVVIGTRSNVSAEVLHEIAGDAEASDRSEDPTVVTVCQLDVRSTESVATFFDRVKAEAGPVDVLVNCAGISVHQTVTGHSDEDWQDVIETNLTGPFKTIRTCLPDMKVRGWGRIINIASTAASSAVETHAAYCASKAGLLGLTRAVALEGAPHGVTCVTVSPTWIETEMLHNSAKTMAGSSDRSVEQVLDELKMANPQRRLVQPDEVAALVNFLCSDAAAAITMEDIQVNAGAHW